MQADIMAYNQSLDETSREICTLLADMINTELPEAESKLWHAHPVWFLEGNPVVGYSRLKDGIRLLFWSGQSFDEGRLQAEGKFKAADIRYQSPGQVKKTELRSWLKKARLIQWDYKNIVKRKGRLERLL